MEEIWKTIKGYPNYSVSNHGRVKSAGRRVRGGSFFERDYLFSQNPDAHGYVRVILREGKCTQRFKVHRLVCEAFLPNPYGKPYVNHKNGIKTDNSIGNLEWVTSKENSQHARHVTKTLRTGSGVGTSKLSENDVLDIRSMHFFGATPSSLAQAFGVTPTNIRYIINRRWWRHI